MAIFAATQTSKNSVKPVGENIDLLFYYEPPARAGLASVNQQWDYDYEIDSNYAVIDLEVTKTIKAVAAGNTLSVMVLRVPAGNDAAVTLSATDCIAQCAMAPATLVGTKVKAGVVTATFQPTIGASGAISSAGVTTVNTNTNLLINSSGASTVVNGITVMNNTVMPVNANAGSAVGTTSKQRIRIIVSGTITDVDDASISLSCLIRVKLCRISAFELLQSGAQTRDNEGLEISAP